MKKSFAITLAALTALAPLGATADEALRLETRKSTGNLAAPVADATIAPVIVEEGTSLGSLGAAGPLAAIGGVLLAAGIIALLDDDDDGSSTTTTE